MRLMTWLTLMAAVCLALGVALPARAECVTATSATAGATCVSDVMVLGSRGVWFDLKTSEDVLFKFQAFPKLEYQIEEQGKLNVAWRKEVDALRQAIAGQRAIEKRLQEQLNLAAADAQRAREELANAHRWWKSPVFWGITMFVAGAALQNIYVQSQR